MAGIYRYANYTEKNPLKSTVISSSLIMSCGDYIMQKFEKSQLTIVDKIKWKLDTLRLKNMAIYGLISGTISYCWYIRLLPKLVYSKTQTKIMETGKKLILDQFAFTPIYYLMFLYSVTRLDGKNHSDGKDKIYKDFYRCFIMDLKVWPILQTLNFYFLPNHLQVVFITSEMVFWSAYLSHVKNT